MTPTGPTSAADLPLPVASPTVTRSSPRVVGAAGPPAIAAVATFVVFLPSLWNGFVNWDDTTNFLNNPDYRGLGWKNLRWMATTFLLGQWIPLTWLTLGLDYIVWGMDPFGYHLTSVLLHTATTVAFYFVARRLLAMSAPSWSPQSLATAALAAALFFGIHPLRAESVAWVTERRDVLSGLFFMLALLGYLRAREEGPRSRLWFGLSVGAYALAALSKSIVVSLPIVLLLLDVYPLRRLGSEPRRGRRARELIVEKGPYFLVALITGLMAIWAQQSNRFLTPLDQLSMLDRIPVVLYSLWFYLAKTVLPTGLSPLYELPARVSLLEPRFLGAAVGAAAAGAVVILLGRRWMGLRIAAAAYAAMLAPVSGLLHNGHQLVHDRYSYLPCLPWAILFGAGVALLLAAIQQDRLRPPLAALATVTATAWLAALGFQAAEQTKVWRDDDTLWRYALDADPKCSICRSNLGLSLGVRGLTSLAIVEFEQAVALRPDRVRTHGNLGVALLREGRLAEALEHLRTVLARHPDDLNARNNLAVALLRLGRREEALAELRGILKLDPDNVLARIHLAAALVDDHRAGEGVPMLERVIAEKPDQIPARTALVRGYLALRRHDDARHALEALRRLDPRAATHLDGLFVTAW